MEEAASKFSIKFVRDVVILGVEHHVALITKLLKGYYFLQARRAEDLSEVRADPYFIVATVDFTDVQRMQSVAKAFDGLRSPLAHCVIYVIAPNDLSREQLLFAQEVGARFVASGPTKNDDLREYLKRICVEYHQVGSLVSFEQDIEQAKKAGDRAAMQRVLERLKALPADSEDGLRLLITVSTELHDLKRAESYLKRLLQINPQNLWAANSLGKLYLRGGKASEGMEMLEKLSQFHLLNSERLLTLGNAYAVVGKPREAEETLKKGVELTGGQDDRFKEGLAKVKLADRDLKGALAFLGDRSFSTEMISFLNMRAILAIRAGNFDEGMEYYNYAVKGADKDNDLKARLMFNMGLAYVRTSDLERAKDCFKESCDLGGPRFSRASGPLKTVTNVIKNGGKAKKSDANDIKEMDDLEWETLY